MRLSLKWYDWFKTFFFIKRDYLDDLNCYVWVRENQIRWGAFRLYILGLRVKELPNVYGEVFFRYRTTMPLPKIKVFRFELENLKGLTEKERVEKFQKSLSEYLAILNSNGKNLCDMFRSTIF